MTAGSPKTFGIHGNYTVCCTVTVALPLVSDGVLKTIGNRKESFSAFFLQSLVCFVSAQDISLSMKFIDRGISSISMAK